MKALGSPLDNDSRGDISAELLINEKGGMKYSKNKRKWIYFPFDAAGKIMDVMDYGSKKYNWNNWRNVDVEEFLSAACRHLFAHILGKKYDESGLTHLNHCGCNILFAIWKEECENGEDSKIKKG